jgi:hypothetical protein
MKPDSRKILRFAVQLPVFLVCHGKEEQGTVLNLSFQGCAITTANVPAVSTYVSLRIDPLNGKAPLDIELAAVRWVSGRRCGLEFIRMAPEMMDSLRAFVTLLEETP